MKTVQRLKDAYTHGRLEMFDETSKYVSTRCLSTHGENAFY